MARNSGFSIQWTPSRSLSVLRNYSHKRQTRAKKLHDDNRQLFNQQRAFVLGITGPKRPRQWRASVMHDLAASAPKAGSMEPWPDCALDHPWLSEPARPHLSFSAAASILLARCQGLLNEHEIIALRMLRHLGR